MSDQVNMEDVWSTRSEKYGKRLLVGLQNQLPQTYEDEKQLFALLDLRKNQIKDQVMDGNTYMVIHDDGSKMTVAVLVNECNDLPEGMVLLTLPEQSYEVFRFEEKYICDFWKFFCESQNQNRYHVDTVKPRYETFNDSLQPNGITEIFFPKTTLAIRPVDLGDIHGIQRVAKTTWNDTYETIYKKDFIHSFLEQAYSHKNLEAAILRDERRAIRKFMVAQINDEIVAYAQLTETKDGEAELSRIYVLTEFQGRGIGKSLLREFLSADKTLKSVFAWVEKDNQIGAQFYKANDFKVSDYKEETIQGQTVRLNKYTKQVM